MSHLIQINREVANKQFKSINEIVKFVNDQNFFGDVYQEHRLMQIEASKYWIDTFLPSKDKFKEHKEKINDISFTSNKMNVEIAVDLSKSLI